MLGFLSQIGILILTNTTASHVQTWVYLRSHEKALVNTYPVCDLYVSRCQGSAWISVFLGFTCSFLNIEFFPTPIQNKAWSPIALCLLYCRAFVVYLVTKYSNAIREGGINNAEDAGKKRFLIKAGELFHSLIICPHIDSYNNHSWISVFCRAGGYPIH
jgi:hypothetical protein